MFVAQYQQVGGGQGGTTAKIIVAAPAMPGLLNQKQLFAEIEINVWIPRDPYILTHDFHLQDVIEVEIEKLEKIQYQVSIFYQESIPFKLQFGNLSNF